jgi:hypothetical protein
VDPNPPREVELLPGDVVELNGLRGALTGPE